MKQWILTYETALGSHFMSTFESVEAVFQHCRVHGVSKFHLESVSHTRRHRILVH